MDESKYYDRGETKLVKPPCRSVEISRKSSCKTETDTLWLFNIAMENGPFMDDFPIELSIYRGFSMAMLNHQMIEPLWKANIDRCSKNAETMVRSKHTMAWWSG